MLIDFLVLVAVKQFPQISLLTFIYLLVVLGENFIYVLVLSLKIVKLCIHLTNNFLL